MLGLKMIDTGSMGATRQAVKRRVAFAQGNDVLFRNLRKKLAEAPDAALVEGMARGAAAEPESLEQCGIEIVLIERG